MRMLTPLGLLLGLIAAGCNQLVEERAAVEPGNGGPAAAANADEDEVDIPLDQVPAVVIKAAMDAVPGFEPEEAEMEVEDGVTVYSIEGEAGDDEFEIEVTAEGEVLEIEEDDEEDDDDDDDDYDDD